MAVDFGRQLGPMPVWGWAVVGGGVLVLVFAKRGVPAAAAAANPNAAVPAPPPLPALTIPGGSGVYDPNTGSSTPPVSLADLLGGQSMSAFLQSLGPNFSQFVAQIGNAGVSVSNSPQNAIDLASHEADVAFNTNVYDANRAAMAAGYQQELAFDTAALDLSRGTILNPGQTYVDPRGFVFHG